ncbi:Vms1/Ankzf1 family peptidyl-tRNA hydrolase [Streptomyces sp. FXJ1.4098]|nr:Vms1/Ankzf1 family peptidyl-tRNA hydrolase [Streptomyces sp. FXJ1.4098]
MALLPGGPRRPLRSRSRTARRRRPAPRRPGERRTAAGRGHRSVPADRYEWHYRNRVENTLDQTADVVADELARRWPESDARLLVLAGDPRERRAVHDRLPEPLRASTVQAQHGSRAAGSSRELLEAEIERAREEYVRTHLEDVLDLFRAAGPPGGAGGGRGP